MAKKEALVMASMADIESNDAGFYDPFVF